MTKTLYLDTNVFLDVFELRDPTLYGRLRGLTESGVELVVSELTLMETLAGNHRDPFASGIDRLLALSPRWLHMTGLPIREVAQEYSRFKSLRVIGTIGTPIDWTTLVPLITTRDALKDIPDLQKPTARALLETYPPGSIHERRKYWKVVLREQQSDVREMLTYVGHPRNVLRKVVAWTLDRNLGQTRELADELIANPDRAPAFRIDIELACLVLNVPNPKWTTNDFIDHLHAGAIPYVDLFGTRDGTRNEFGLLQKMQWYDDNVRRPAGVDPYGPKICRSLAEVEAKV